MLQTVLTKASKTKPVSIEAKAEIDARFETIYPRIYAYIRYRVAAVQDAEDLVNVIFERAFTRYDQFDETKGQFSTWLFQIAHNMLANHFRSHERRSAWQSDKEPPIDFVAPNASLEDQFIKQEAVIQLLRNIAHLSERDQEVISLKFAGKLSNREIGEIMDVKEKTVSVVLLRAIRRLKKQMDKEAAS